MRKIAFLVKHELNARPAKIYAKIGDETPQLYC